MEGRIHSLETFGLVDGPGVRFVIFMQGCGLRCGYCHNPDTWDVNGGKIWTAEKLFEKAYRYKPYWLKGGKLNGGITVSGGEPLLQAEFVAELFQICHEHVLIPVWIRRAVFGTKMWKRFWNILTFVCSIIK